MSVIDVVDSNEFKNSTSTGFAVVDYSAIWCGPCKRVEPVFRELAQNHKKIKFLHIDIDHASETEGLSDVVNKIRSVPTFHFYRDGKIIDVLSGGNIAQLKSKVDSLGLLVATQQQIEHKKEDKIDDKANNSVAVIEINHFEEFKNYLLSGLAVVDYSATWCGPCKRLEPVFKELAQSNKNMKFLHIDIDHASETEGLNRLVGAIRSVPTFHFYRDGKVVDTLSGANIIQLKNKVEYLSSLAPITVVTPNVNNNTDLIKIDEKKREKTYEEKQEDKIEKKKAKTEDVDDKREKFKSKSPDHHKEDDNKRTRDTSRKRDKAADDKKEDHPIIIEERKDHGHPVGTVIEIEDSIELINLTQSGLAVIDYSATWCGPCKIVAPVYKELASHYKAIKFLHIDIDHAAETEGLSELVDKIRSVPTFHFYRDGKIIDFLYGGNVSQLKIKIDALNALGVLVAAAAAAANEKKNAMIAAAAATNATTMSVAAPSVVVEEKAIEPKKITKLPIVPVVEERKEKPISIITAIPTVITSAPAPMSTISVVADEEQKKAIAASHAAAISSANAAAVAAVVKVIEEKKEDKHDNNDLAIINPITDIYNSIEFINSTSAGLALVDYSAVWCPPCVRVQPILRDIAQNYKNIKFLHVDIDHAADTDLAELVDKISSVPTFHFYAEGRVVDTLQGANIAQLRSKVENLNVANGNGAALTTSKKETIETDKKDEDKKEHKKKSKSSEDKKASDKKKKRKSKKKEKESKAAAAAASSATNPISKEKSNADATSAATTASIINTKAEIHE